MNYGIANLDNILRDLFAQVVSEVKDELRTLGQWHQVQGFLKSEKCLDSHFDDLLHGKIEDAIGIVCEPVDLDAFKSNGMTEVDLGDAVFEKVVSDISCGIRY